MEKETRLRKLNYHEENQSNMRLDTDPVAPIFMHLIEQTIRDVLRPPDELPAHRWAELNFVIDGRANSVSGEFTTANVGFVREVLDRLSDNEAESVSLMCASQVLKSTLGHCTLARAAVEDPGSAMWVAQSKDEAKIMLRDRMIPSFRKSPLLARMMPTGRFSITNAQVDFDSMPLYMGWGGSEAKLQSKPVRYLFLDEPELYPDRIADARKRVKGFWNSKVCMFGNPKLIGGVMDTAFRNGHQAFWRVRCMKCSAPMPIHWGKDWYGGRAEHPGIRWDQDEEEPWFECEVCNHRHFQSAEVRRHFANEGVWVAVNDAASNPKSLKSGEVPRQRLSYTWGTLIFPIGPSWMSLKAEFIQASHYAKQGIMEPLQEFVNKQLGEPFDPNQYETQWLREPVVYDPNQQWVGEADRFITADVQQDVLYAICRAVAATGASRLLDARKLVDFHALRDMQTEFRVKDMNVCLDSAYREPEVIRECSRYGWTPMKGSGDEQRLKYLKWQRGGKKTPSLWKPGWARVDKNGNEHAQIDMRNVPPHIKKIISDMPQKKTFLLILFASEGAMDILDALMRGGEIMPDWQYPANVPPEYLTHLGAAKKIMLHEHRGRVIRWVYKKGADHYLACERMCVVCMVAAGFLKASPIVEETQQSERTDGVER